MSGWLDAKSLILKVRDLYPWYLGFAQAGGRELEDTVRVMIVV